MNKRTSLKRLLSVFIVCVTALSLAACGNSANKEPQLDSTASKNGVTFAIKSSWTNNLNGKGGNIEPSMQTVINVYTFTEGETSSLESLKNAGMSLGGNTEGYAEDGNFQLSNGTKVTYYTNKTGTYLYSCIVGYHESDGTGFLIALTRNRPADPNELDDDTYEALVKSVKFDPSKAVDYLASKKNAETGGSGGSSDSSSSSSSTNAKSTTGSSSSSSSSATTSQKKALSRAKSYLKNNNFSYSGLVDQLEYEGFSEEDATYGVDNCGADWNAQALGKAKSYLKHSAHYYTGLIEQLEYEGFDEDQATYGVNNCGADWMEQAEKKAASYMKHSSYSRSRLIEQLEYEGFTAEQAEHGADSQDL